MIFIATSVWVEVLRTRESSAARQLGELQRGIPLTNHQRAKKKSRARELRARLSDIIQIMPPAPAAARAAAAF